MASGAPVINIDEEGLRLLRRDKTITRSLERLRFGIRVLDLATSIANVGVGSDNLYRYWSSSNVPPGESAWPPPGSLVLWPSYFCFAVAIVSVIFGTIILLSYYWGAETANKWDGRHGWFTKAAMLAKFALSAAVAGSMYSTSAPSTTSLWGISCNTEPASFTQKLINFGSFCSLQKLMFSLSIINAFSEFLTGLTYVFQFWSTSHKKKMDKHNSMMTVSSPTTATVEGKLGYAEVKSVEAV